MGHCLNWRADRNPHTPEAAEKRPEQLFWAPPWSIDIPEAQRTNLSVVALFCIVFSSVVIGCMLPFFIGYL
eukprot:gene16118-4886_t